MPASTAIATARAIIGTIRVGELAGGCRRADEDGDDEQVAESLHGDDDRQREQDEQGGFGDPRRGAQRARGATVEASRQQPSVQCRSRPLPTTTARTPAAARSVSLGPRMSPKRIS